VSITRARSSFLPDNRFAAPSIVWLVLANPAYLDDPQLPFDRFASQSANQRFNALTQVSGGGTVRRPDDGDARILVRWE